MGSTSKPKCHKIIGICLLLLVLLAILASLGWDWYQHRTTPMFLAKGVYFAVPQPGGVYPKEAPPGDSPYALVKGQLVGEIQRESYLPTLPKTEWHSYKIAAGTKVYTIDLAAAGTQDNPAIQTCGLLLELTDGSLRFAYPYALPGEEPSTITQRVYGTFYQEKLETDLHEEMTGTSKQMGRDEITQITMNREITKALFQAYDISLTPEEEEYIAGYHAATMQMIEAAAQSDDKTEREQAQETLDLYWQIIKESGLTQEEYEEEARQQIAYLMQKDKLIDAQFDGDETTLQDYIDTHQEEFHVSLIQ